MNRKICYLILLLVQVLGTLFQVFMLLSGEPENGENPPIIWLSSIRILLWLAVATTDPLFLFSHRYPTGCFLLGETTKGYQGKQFLTRKKALSLRQSLYLLFHFATFNNEVICFCSISVGWVKSFLVSFVEEVFFSKLLNVIVNEIEEFFVSFLNRWCDRIWITK